MHLGAFGPPVGEGESLAAFLDGDPEQRRAAAVRIAVELICADQR